MPKIEGQKRYLSDRATKELFQIKEFRDKIIGGILGDKITEEELQSLETIMPIFAIAEWTLSMKIVALL